MTPGAPIPSPHHHAPSRNPKSNHPRLPPKPCRGGNPTVSRGGRRFSSNLSLRFYLGTLDGATSAIPSASGHHLTVPNVDNSKPAKLSGPNIDPTAAYQNEPDWKSTLHASAGLVIDVVKESSDVFTPLKAVAGGLSAILKHYDVRRVNSFKPFSPLTPELANCG